MSATLRRVEALEAAIATTPGLRPPLAHLTLLTATLRAWARGEAGSEEGCFALDGWVFAPDVPELSPLAALTTAELEALVARLEDGNLLERLTS